MSWRMRNLPVAEPGVPDRRSPAKLLLWVGKQQLGSLALGVTFGIAWMVAQALMPYTIGRAIQDGIVEDELSALVTWAALLLGLGIVQGFAGVMRHRFAVQNWLRASFLLVQVVGHHAARAGRRSGDGTPPARSSRRSRTTRFARAAPSTSPRGWPGRSSRTSSSR